MVQAAGTRLNELVTESRRRLAIAIRASNAGSKFKGFAEGLTLIH